MQGKKTLNIMLMSLLAALMMSYMGCSENNPMSFAASDDLQQPQVTESKVKIENLDEGSIVSGIFGVKVRAEQDIRIAQVKLYVDGKYIGRDRKGPFLIDWDTFDFSNGGHKLSAEGFDAVSQEWRAVSISVVVANR